MSKTKIQKYGFLLHTLYIIIQSITNSSSCERFVRKRLFADPVLANKNLFAGTVPENKNLFARIVPVNKDLFAGTRPVGSLYL